MSKPKALIPAKQPYGMFLFHTGVPRGQRMLRNGFEELIKCATILKPGTRVVMLLMSLEFQRLQTNVSEFFKALGRKYKNIIFNTKERHWLNSIKFNNGHSSSILSIST